MANVETFIKGFSLSNLMGGLKQQYERDNREVQRIESYLPANIDQAPFFGQKTTWKCDLKGFTDTTQQKLLEGKIAVDGWNIRMGEICGKFDIVENPYNGKIQYFEGDAGAALFDNPHDAILAAADIAQAILAMPPEKANKREIKLNIRQGIATGNVFTAIAGDARRIPVIGGQGLAKAYELEERATPGRVRIDKETYLRLRSSLPFEQHGEEYELAYESTGMPQKFPPVPLDHPETDEWYASEIEKLRERKRYALSFFAPLTREEILQGHTGRLEKATLMFGDMPTLRELAIYYDGSPEILLDIYNAHFEALQEIEKQFNGEIDKLYKSVFMARFRSRTDYGGEKLEHFEAAREASTRLNEWMQKNERLQELLAKAGIEYQAPYIGFATGPVYVGPVGSEQRRAFTMLGSEVNLAARLMKAAHEHPTKRILTNLREGSEEIGEAELKGLGRTKLFKPITGYTKIMRKKTLVGRDAEIERLHGILGLGESQLVSIVADAGYGKTELTKFVEKMFRQKHTSYQVIEGQEVPVFNGTVYKASAVQQAKDIPDYILQDLVKNALRITSSDNKEQTKAKLDSIVDGEHRKIAHQWLGLSLGYEKPTQTGKELEEARKQMLLGLVKEGPKMLVFNDVHWADENSLKTIEWLNEKLSNTVVLTNYRPKEITREVKGTKIELGALTQTGVSQLVAHQIGAMPDTELAEFVYSQSKGIPLYIEEVVNFLKNNGHVHDGKLTAKVETITIPDSIEKLVLERYRALRTPELQTILQYASCMFGEEFPKRLLESALGKKEGELDLLLNELAKQDFINTQGGTIEFKHNLVKNAIYETAIRPIERAKAHTKIGDTRKELYGEGNDQLVALAWDYENGEDVEKAVHYNWLTERMFITNKEYETGISYSYKIENLVKKSDNLSEKAKYGQGLSLNGRGVALKDLRRLSESVEVFDKVSEIADTLPEHFKDQLMLRVYANLGSLNSEDIKKIKQYHKQGLRLAQKLNQKSIEATLWINAGLASKGEKRIKRTKRAIALLEKSGDSYDLALSWNNLIIPLVETKRLDEAENAAMRSFAIAQRIGHKEMQGRAKYGLANIYSNIDLMKAKAAYEEAEEYLVNLNTPLTLAFYESWIQCAIKLGLKEQALVLYEKFNEKLKLFSEDNKFIKIKKELDLLFSQNK